MRINYRLRPYVSFRNDVDNQHEPIICHEVVEEVPKRDNEDATILSHVAVHVCDQRCQIRKNGVCSNSFKCRKLTHEEQENDKEPENDKEQENNKELDDEEELDNKEELDRSRG